MLLQPGWVRGAARSCRACPARRRFPRAAPPVPLSRPGAEGAALLAGIALLTSLGSLFGRKGKGFPGCAAVAELTFWRPGCLLVFEA